MNSLVRVILAIALPVFSLSLVAQSPEIMTVESPSALTILNRFEQNVSAHERILFFSNVPLRIVRQNVLLSDQFTRAMEVELGRERFFLQRRSNGELTGASEAGAVRFLGAIRSVSDTIQTLVRGRLIMAQQAGVYLDANEKLERFFEMGGRYFACHLRSGTYGWLDMDSAAEGRAWRSIKPSVRNDRVSLMSELQFAVDDLNRIASLLTAEIGGTAPRWQTRTEADRWVVNRSNADERWNRTDQALLRKIQGLFIGRRFTYSYHPGELTILFR